MVWGIVSFFIGMAVGYFSPGRQDKKRLLRTGLLWGAVIAVVFALLAVFLDANPFGFAANFLGNLIGIVIVLLLFLAGVWVGDWLEHRRDARRVEAP